MEKYTLESDIPVLCVTATSFPEGVMAAYDKIHSIVPKEEGRRVFGISRPEGGSAIVYKAAVEELSAGEAERYHVERFIIRKGEYTSVIITDFMKDLPAIGKTFQEILHTQKVDHNGACIEWYFNQNDVQCMVRLEE